VDAPHQKIEQHDSFPSPLLLLLRHGPSRERPRAKGGNAREKPSGRELYRTGDYAAGCFLSSISLRRRGTQIGEFKRPSRVWPVVRRPRKPPSATSHCVPPVPLPRRPHHAFCAQSVGGHVNATNGGPPSETFVLTGALRGAKKSRKRADREKRARPRACPGNFQYDPRGRERSSAGDRERRGPSFHEKSRPSAVEGSRPLNRIRSAAGGRRLPTERGRMMPESWITKRRPLLKILRRPFGPFWLPSTRPACPVGVGMAAHVHVAGLSSASTRG